MHGNRAFLEVLAEARVVELLLRYEVRGVEAFPRSFTVGGSPHRSSAATASDVNATAQAVVFGLLEEDIVN